MILRLLGPQGIAGLVASLCLALLLVLQKGETRHWRKQSDQYQQLHAAEQSKLAGTIANYRAAADAARAADRANAERVAAEQRAVNQRTQNDLKPALLLLALPLTACASKPSQPQPIPAVAEQRQCPAYPLPPAGLLKPPLKTDFLSTGASPPPSRRSSSTN